jgi:tRNA dimethylallyltransferase
LLLSPTLIVICGATATGKTGLAIKLAQHFGSVILSADSRQVYREMNIATAKPTAAEQAVVPHYFVNTHEPCEVLTVAEYQANVQKSIQSFHAQGISPLLVGGTGLYIKSITRGMKIPRVAPQPSLRKQLESIDQSILYGMLQQVDPQSKIHGNDRHRTLRALEVFYVTGRSITSQQGESPPNYRIIQIGLDCVDLEQRIRQRAEQMLAMGWEQEVRDLITKHGWDLPNLDTLGYAEMRQYLRGEIGLNEAIELTILHTCQFVKRQRTWFRGISGIIWLDSNDVNLVEKAIKLTTSTALSTQETTTIL